MHHIYSEITSLYLLLQTLILRVEPGTPSYKEPKFIVFFSMLLSLFTMVCFKCNKSELRVTMKQRGTMVVVCQHCTTCGDNAFSWRSQPLIFGKYPAGNMLLSFGVLMAGASISKVLLVMRHRIMCLQCQDILCASEELPVSCHFKLLGTVQSISCRKIKEHGKCCLEWGWAV